MTTVLITGTDTNVGKTYVSSLLLRALAESGRRCAGLKPIASGCNNESGKLTNADALSLMASSSVKLSYAQTNPYAFEPPIAPHIAARAAGIKVELAQIVAAVNAAETLCDDVVVEGAGGWLSPLTEGLGAEVLDHADLAHALSAPVLLVVGIRLGCINHARLSVKEIARSGVRLLGWIANVLPAADPMLALEENISSLIELLPTPMLARVGGGCLQDSGLAAAMVGVNSL